MQFELFAVRPKSVDTLYDGSGLSVRQELARILSWHRRLACDRGIGVPPVKRSRENDRRDAYPTLTGKTAASGVGKIP